MLFLFILEITALIFFLTGLILYKFPPKKINSLYGYRTRNSMRNQERWDFSQKYSGKIMMWSSFGMAFIGLTGLFMAFSESLQTIFSLSIVIITCVFLLIKTEKEIIKRFGKSE